MSRRAADANARTRPRSSDPKELVARLVEAIDGRHEVRLLYGSAMSLRLAWPHALGISGAGNPTLLAWQTGGARTAGGGWKHFNLAKIAAVELSDATFEGPAPGYNRDAPGLEQVLKAI